MDAMSHRFKIRGMQGADWKKAFKLSGTNLQDLKNYTSSTTRDHCQRQFLKI
jgi:hypothetical protein